MKHIGLRTCSALALAGIAWAAPLPAQQSPRQAPAAAGTPGGWEVNWGDQHCMLIRNSGGSGTRAFALRRVPGSGPTDLITIDPSPPQDAAPSRRDISILLRPSTEPLEGRVYRSGRVDNGNMVIEMNGGDDLLERFAESTAIEVTTGRRSHFRMSYPSPTAALAALKQCEDDALLGWGIDPALIAGVRTRPRQTNRELITSDDYPADAVRAHQEGVALVRLIINSDGRAEDCAIVASSGSAALDRQSCTLSQNRGRFRPARDAEGRPVRSVFVQRVVWHLPE